MNLQAKSNLPKTRRSKRISGGSAKTDIVFPYGITQKDCHWNGRAWLWSGEVTRLMAGQWLEKNQLQRPDSAVNLEYLVRQIKQGKAMYIGRTIKFTKKGLLIDGQHTCMAINQTDTPLFLDVVIGLDEAAFYVIDTNKSRNGSDVLSIAGYKDAKQLSSIARFVIDHQRQNYSSLGRAARRSVDNTDIVEFVKTHPKLPFVARKAINWYMNGERLLTVKISGGLFYLFRKKHSGKAKRFFDMLLIGTEIPNNHPVFHLRKLLLKNKMDPNKKLKLAVIIRATIVAWNHFRKDEFVKSLDYNMKDPFPKIK